MFSKRIGWLMCVFVAVATASDNREPDSITGRSVMESDGAGWAARHPALYPRAMDTSNGHEPMTDYPPTLRDPQLTPQQAKCKKLRRQLVFISEENAVHVAVLALKNSCESLIRTALDFIHDNVHFVLIHAIRTKSTEWDVFMRLLTQRNAATSRKPSPAPTQTTTPATTQLPSQASTATATPMATCPTSLLRDDQISFYRGLSEEEKNGKLIEAAKQGDIEDLRTLLAAGAFPGEKDMQGRTALQWAAWLGYVEAARCLLDAGADVDTVDNEDYRPMHRAAMAGHPYVVRLLRAWGADPDAQDVRRWTPLHLTVRENRPETAIALLEAGANKEIKDETGLTPLDMAKKGNKQELIDVLKPSLE